MKKTIFKLLGTTILMLSLIFSITPISTNAATYATLDEMHAANGGSNIVAVDDTLEVNDGRIEVNNGTIESNIGIVTENMGTVITNAENATVVTNYANISANNGDVDTNFGTINNNNHLVAENNGTINNNYGNVGGTPEGNVINNTSSGTVEGGNISVNYGEASGANIRENHGSATGSTIVDNMGTALNSTVENNWGTVSGASSTVSYNYGGTLSNGATSRWDTSSLVNSNPIMGLEGTVQPDPPVEERTSVDFEVEKGNSIEISKAPSSIVIDGKKITSTIRSSIISDSFIFAVTTPLDTIISMANFSNNETPCIDGYEFSESQAPLAYQSLKYVADSHHGKIVSCIELNLGKISSDSFAKIDEPLQVNVILSSPIGKFNPHKKYMIAKTDEFGNTEVCRCLFDPNNNTISFKVSNGEAAYALIEH